MLEKIRKIGLRYYRKARYNEIDGDDEQATQNYLKAIEVWERVLQEFSPSGITPRIYFVSAVVYGQELHQHIKGIECFQHIVDNYPDHQHADRAQYTIGEYYERAGRDDESISQEQADVLAEQAYNAVRENYPDSTIAPIALLRVGNLRFRGEKWAEAALYFEQFLGEYPEHEKLLYVLYKLGTVYEKLGYDDLAIWVYEAFTGLADPDDSRLGTVEARLNLLEEQN